MVVAVQRVLDDATEISVDRSVRLLEAQVLAAELSSEAAVEGSDGDMDPDGPVLAALRARCEQVAADYRDAVSTAEWTQVLLADATTAWTCRLTGHAA
jgi:hypothetical protein